jgi:hypothetical protein
MSNWEETALAYVTYGRTQSEELFWAFEAATMMAFLQRWDDLWELTLCAIALTPESDNEALAFIAAGSLEDLIRYAAPELESRIMEQIRIDAKFRKTLTGAWARQERADFWRNVTPLLYEFPTEPLT